MVEITESIRFLTGEAIKEMESILIPKKSTIWDGVREDLAKAHPDPQSYTEVQYSVPRPDAFFSGGRLD